MVQAQVPFVCNGLAYFAYRSSFYTLDFNTQQSNYISTTGDINALGFNPNDNLIYGLESQNHSLVILDATGTIFNLGPVIGLPSTGFPSGVIDVLGRYYVKSSSGTYIDTLYIIDLNVQPYQVTQKVKLSQGINMSDLAYGKLNQHLYGISQTGTSYVYEIDPVSGLVTQLPTPVNANQAYGALWIDDLNVLYAYGNTTGSIYASDLFINDWNVFMTPNLPSGSGGIDGAYCSLPLTARCKPDTVYADINGDASIVFANMDDGSGPTALIDSGWLSQYNFNVCGTDSFEVNLYVQGGSILDSCSSMLTVVDTFPKNTISEILVTDSSICTGESITFSYDSLPGFTAVWDFGAGQSGNLNQYTFSYTNAGASDSVFVVSVTASNCVDTNTVSQNITVFASPTATAQITPSDYCVIDSNGAIDVTPGAGLGPYGFGWSNTATTEDLTDIPGGNYTLTVTDANGCTFTDNYTVASNLVTASYTMTGQASPSVYCEVDSNGSIDVTVNGTSGPYTYSWSNAATTEDLSQVPSGSYMLTVSDNDGCTLTDTYTVSGVTEGFPDLFSTDATCFGALGNVFTSTEFDSIFVNGIGYTSTSSIDLPAGTYTATVVNSLGCDTTINFTITQPDSLSLTLTATADSVLAGETVKITSQTGGTGSLSWWPANILDCAGCLTVEATPTQSGYIHATYGDPGCEVTDSVYVTVYYGEVFVPNVFTPNGDGRNDVFEVYSNDVVRLDMKIFNRWGELVYHCNGDNCAWDGTKNGKPLLPGVYVVSLTIQTHDSRHLKFVEQSLTLYR